MPNCYQCTVGEPNGGIGIGVCSKCHAIACSGHGGKLRGTPDFRCTGCLPTLLTVYSAMQSPQGGPDGGNGGGPSGGPGGDKPGGGPDGAAPIRNSPDFEGQLPTVARASRAHRYAIDGGAIRRGIRTLFRLLAYADERDAFCDQAIVYVTPEVSALVHRELTERVTMRAEFEVVGGEAGLAESYLGEIREDVTDWLANGLGVWMSSLRTELDEYSWLDGEQPVNIPLLADAIGLARYTWGLRDGESPYQRLHLVRTAAPEMLVLTELCGLGMPMLAGET